MRDHNLTRTIRKQLIISLRTLLLARCKTTLPPIKSLSRTSNNESRNTITGAERVFNQGRTPDPALVTDDKEGGGGVSTVTKEQSVTQPASPADIGDTSGSQNDRLQDTRTKDVKTSLVYT